MSYEALPIAADLRLPIAADLSESSLEMAIDTLRNAGASTDSLLVVCGIEDRPEADEAIEVLRTVHCITVQVNQGYPAGRWDLCAVGRTPGRLFIVRNPAP